MIPGIEEPKIPETEELEIPETEEPEIPETEEPEIPETEEPKTLETEEPETLETEEPEDPETEEPETLETEEPEDPETEEPEDTRSELSSGRISGLKDLTYTGAALTQKMEVIVDGSILKPGKDYKVTYKNNKAVGTAQVKVTGIGNYTGTLSGSFSINPKPVKLKKLTGKKKSITVKWEKPSAQVSGCQIQYSISKTFESESRILTAAGKNKKSAKIKNLKAKKTYYVRIRTYKTVNGQTYYSAWSKSMKIKTKK